MLHCDAIGRTAVQEFLKKQSDIKATNENGRIFIAGDYAEKIEISRILHQWLVRQNVISDFN